MIPNIEFPQNEQEREVLATLEVDENQDDYGTVITDEEPGENDPISFPVQKTKILAQRVSQVSDTIYFGQANVPADQSAYLFIPAHRDRLRVTIQAVIPDGGPTPYIGSQVNTDSSTGWGLVTSDPLTFETRDAIYLATGAGDGTVLVQWASELVAEGCGCQ